MEIEKLLPIGSIVKLKDAEKRLMIFGIKQSGTKDEESIETDYIGVLYPEGNMGNEYQYLFNHEHIEEIIFHGFEDNERDMFIEKVSKAFADKNKA